MLKTSLAGFSPVMNRRLLDALEGKNQGPPPVWMMRQAGRALPEYRKIREKRPLHDLFHSPKEIIQITRMPVDSLGVDAAILFSDILIPLEALGYTLRYESGKTPSAHKTTPNLFDISQVDYVFEAISKMDLDVPLIGFAGGPYTVATYVEKEPSDALLDQITEITIEYLKAQIKAGANVLQIFDSWASKDFTRAHPRLKKIFYSLQDEETPLIIFCRNTSDHLEDLIALNPSAISCDWKEPLHLSRKRIPKRIACQGNLDPTALLKPQEELLREVETLLFSMKEDPAYIFNLGHGVLPDTPVSNLQAVVQKVQESPAIAKAK
ncbi:MAG: uroporphyrinogen decarboxylase family protein [Simkaniaceae bacterium]